MDTLQLFKKDFYERIGGLKRFKEISNGYPYNLTEKEWGAVLSNIVMTFEFLSSDDVYTTETDVHIGIRLNEEEEEDAFSEE